MPVSLAKGKVLGTIFKKKGFDDRKLYPLQDAFRIHKGGPIQP
jgi:hypothetical protein